MTTNEEILDELKTVYDPEIRVNIVDLGLIYSIEFDKDSGFAKVIMTLTTPNCPMSEQLKRDVTQTTLKQDGVKEVMVDIVWDPPWERSMMSEEAKLMLGMDI